MYFTVQVKLKILYLNSDFKIIDLVSKVTSHAMDRGVILLISSLSVA